jgi:redox-sensitive bicupin YhaK (pirin superfamily)
MALMNSRTSGLILATRALSSPLPGSDPFLFAAYHQDRYPGGNGKLGPSASLLAGRELGNDFSRKDGWSMYHGETVPGFPAHPHRGFETVTIVRKGLVDHADSLGATARYGEGDVQWLTTGGGVQHGEMFPLVHENEDNPLDLFQIWLNLPARNKMVAPAFTMFWASDIPHVVQTDDHGRRSEVMVIAGDYTPVEALPPPVNSWASDPGAGVAIWIVRLEAGASLALPSAAGAVRRTLYLTTGHGVIVGDTRFDEQVMVELDPKRVAPLHNPGDESIEMLLLQGKPIGEPVAARGPFVMNSQQELTQAIRDYQRTEFGGWPWPSRAQTLGKQERFAKHPDGRIERPGNGETP